MPTRFIKLGSAFINPWVTAAVTPHSRDPLWCEVILHSGEVCNVDAPLDVVVSAIEAACADDGIDPNGSSLLSPVGFAR